SAPSSWVPKRCASCSSSAPRPGAVLFGGRLRYSSDLVHLEEEAEPNSDDHLAMRWPERKVVEAPADVGQHRLALGWGGGGYLRSILIDLDATIGTSNSPTTAHPQISTIPQRCGMRLARGSST